MKKRFSMENLDCANCAAKMEAAISKLEVGSVQTTFFLFLLLFTVLLIAEIGIMLKAIRKGVEYN